MNRTLTERQAAVLRKVAEKDGVRRVWFGQGQACWTWRTNDDQPVTQAVDKLLKLDLATVVNRDEVHITPRGRNVLLLTDYGT